MKAVVGTGSCLGKAQPAERLVALGWGRTSEGGSAAEELQEVVVPVLEQRECRNSYGSRISDSMFCAGVIEGGMDSCQGDSGGPLIEKIEKGADQLVGVVSWGHGCARENKPGVYASIGYAKEWIENEIKKASGSSPLPPEPLSQEKPPSKSAECHCTDDGWSGAMRTSRIGCKRHLKASGDNDAFCMVKEGPNCASSTPSIGYPGASWMLCDHPEDDDSDDNTPAEDRGSSILDRLRRQQFRLKLNPLSFQINLRDDESQDVCDCAMNGQSGPIQTPFKGCQQHSRKNGRYDYWCMVKGGSAGCTEAKPSKDYKRAAWRGCDPEIENEQN